MDGGGVPSARGGGSEGAPPNPLRREDPWTAPPPGAGWSIPPGLARTRGERGWSGRDALRCMRVSDSLLSDAPGGESGSELYYQGFFGTEPLVRERRRGGLPRLVSVGQGRRSPSSTSGGDPPFRQLRLRTRSAGADTLLRYPRTEELAGVLPWPGASGTGVVEHPLDALRSGEEGRDPGGRSPLSLSGRMGSLPGGLGGHRRLPTGEPLELARRERFPGDAHGWRRKVEFRVGGPLLPPPCRASDSP